MVFDISHWENSPPPLPTPSQVLWMDLLCKIGFGCILELLSMCVMVHLGSAFVSPCFPCGFEVIERKSCEEVEEFSLKCKSYVNFIFNVDVLAMTSGFLTGSFPMEP